MILMCWKLPNKISIAETIENDRTIQRNVIEIAEHKGMYMHVQEKHS